MDTNQNLNHLIIRRTSDGRYSNVSDSGCNWRTDSCYGARYMAVGSSLYLKERDND